MPTTVRRSNRKNRRRRRRPRRRRIRGAQTARASKRLRPMRRRGIPIAAQRGFRSRYRIRQTADGVIVSGRDLIQPLPDAVAAFDQYYLFATIVSNPCYWTGTRIASIAGMHQCFRPIYFRVGFIPQVAVTQAGTVLTGTNWGTVTSTANFQQSMVTSNGGFMSQCYTPFSTMVKLGTNLQQNLYNCCGPLDTDHNPFTFMAFMRGSNVIPGYFYVDYIYSFKNPLGYAVTYNNFRCQYPEVGEPTADRSLLTLGTIPTFSGPGLMLDLEADGRVTYNDTEVVVPDGLHCMVFTATPIGTGPQQIRMKSVLVTDAPYQEGTAFGAIPNCATWNWDDDTNQARGTFRAGQPVGWGWRLNTVANTITGWANSVDNLNTAYIYAFNTLTQTIGLLYMTARIFAGSNINPSLTIPIQPYNVNRMPMTKTAVMALIEQTLGNHDDVQPKKKKKEKEKQKEKFFMTGSETD